MKIIFNKFKNKFKKIYSIERSIKYFCWFLIDKKRFLYKEINRFIKGEKVVDFDKIYWINPHLIEFHTDLESVESSDIEDRVFNMDKDKGKILDGDWDLSTYRFVDLDIYKAFNVVINDYFSWQDTKFYQNKLKDIESGRVMWRCNSKSDFDKRCIFLSSLIESIRKNGYHLNSNCYIEGEKKGTRGYFEEITVNIGRDGRYLFQDGRHRLSIALLLGIKKIPIKVLVRHKKYSISS